MYNILVTGDRNWTEYPVVFEALTKAWEDFSKYAKTKGTSSRNITVIHGGATGADRIAGTAAYRLGFGTHVYPANWSKYKKGAGPTRNQLMLKENKIDLVLAFHDDLKNSKGTLDMVTRAIQAGIKVRHYRSDGLFIERTQLPFEF
jgi:hypothetical protein